MSDNLQQDIIDELQLLDHLDQFSDDDLKPRANRILKLIEKRIDSLKEQLDSKDDEMMISTLNWVKEMLK